MRSRAQQTAQIFVRIAGHDRFADLLLHRGHTGIGNRLQAGRHRDKIAASLLSLLTRNMQFVSSR